jgi:hypothetical protein
MSQTIRSAQATRAVDPAPEPVPRPPVVPEPAPTPPLEPPIIPEPMPAPSPPAEPPLIPEPFPTAPARVLATDDAGHTRTA